MMINSKTVHNNHWSYLDPHLNLFAGQPPDTSELWRTLGFEKVKLKKYLGDNYDD